jgi:hypothetical protein
MVHTRLAWLALSPMWEHGVGYHRDTLLGLNLEKSKAARHNLRHLLGNS